jgi:SAM-dependent methyltransferase
VSRLSDIRRVLRGTPGATGASQAAGAGASQAAGAGAGSQRSDASAGDQNPTGGLPFPPEQMRALVGLVDTAGFDNPTGAPVISILDPEQCPTVLDFGCGCGRLARQFVQQDPRPRRYLGLDLHAGMIRWCQDNLAPHADGFEFRHHDVLYESFNPGADKPRFGPLGLRGETFSLVLAHSVFTHLTQSQTEFYLAALRDGLAPGGSLLTTWFLFDKRDFPMMQDEQNTLFINEFDIRNAVIYDWAWLRRTAAELGLVLIGAEPPEVRGHQWRLRMTHAGPGVLEIELPEDLADRGRIPPPQMPANADRIGRDSGAT